MLTSLSPALRALNKTELLKCILCTPDLISFLFIFHDHAAAAKFLKEIKVNLKTRVFVFKANKKCCKSKRILLKPQKSEDDLGGTLLE